MKKTFLDIFVKTSKKFKIKDIFELKFENSNFVLSKFELYKFPYS